MQIGIIKFHEFHEHKKQKCDIYKNIYYVAIIKIIRVSIKSFKIIQKYYNIIFFNI